MKEICKGLFAGVAMLWLLLGIAFFVTKVMTKTPVPGCHCSFGCECKPGECQCATGEKCAAGCRCAKGCACCYECQCPPDKGCDCRVGKKCSGGCHCENAMCNCAGGCKCEKGKCTCGPPWPGCPCCGPCAPGCNCGKPKAAAPAVIKIELLELPKK